MKNYRTSNGEIITVEEYKNFMYNKNNIKNCSCCPDNSGFDKGYDDKLPCGQYTCCVYQHCK